MSPFHLYYIVVVLIRRSIAGTVVGSGDYKWVRCFKTCRIVPHMNGEYHFDSDNLLYFSIILHIFIVTWSLT